MDEPCEICDKLHIIAFTHQKNNQNIEVINEHT